jgi:DNA-binding SARP family transcriptional activator
MRPDAARQRLRTAIWTLRKLGLEPLLLTRDDGYLLDPAVPIVRR